MFQNQNIINKTFSKRTIVKMKEREDEDGKKEAGNEKGKEGGEEYNRKKVRNK